MAFGLHPEYVVRDPANCSTVRRIARGKWIATKEDGRSASGSTPASAIAKLKR